MYISLVNRRSPNSLEVANTPPCDFLEEGGIDGGSAALAFLRLGVLVERAFENRLARENAGNIVPFRAVIRVGETQSAAGRGLVCMSRL